MTLFEWTSEMPGLILDAEAALDSGIFDADDNAREQAEALIADGKRLFFAQLSKAYPEGTATKPHEEVFISSGKNTDADMGSFRESDTARRS